MEVVVFHMCVFKGLAGCFVSIKTNVLLTSLQPHLWLMNSFPAGAEDQRVLLEGEGARHV